VSTAVPAVGVATSDTKPVEEEKVMASDALRWYCVMEQHGLMYDVELEPKPGSCEMSAFQQ
jgi:hypothetical protein